MPLFFHIFICGWGQVRSNFLFSSVLSELVIGEQQMPHKNSSTDMGALHLEKGLIVGRRWRIVDKLGEGGCGSVYKVEDIQTLAKAALKAESNSVPGGSVLKLEVQILKRLEGRKYVAQLFQSAKKRTFEFRFFLASCYRMPFSTFYSVLLDKEVWYSYMVMTLLGRSLSQLFRQYPVCTVSTQVRVGINILYGLKQLHEVGYIHRDVKPANLAIGRRGQAVHIIHILDFGLSREYVIRNNGSVKLRMPRTNTLFRGTVKYCSANTHKRNEQGRPDDLWSMLYVLVEMRGSLPWENVRFTDPYDWEEPTAASSIGKGLTYVSRSLSRLHSRSPSSVDIISESKSTIGHLNASVGSEVTGDDLFKPGDFESNETGF
uniref:Protein kinase domain-containing protein n=1 Tax=Setaria digitata TaxID=48799 RepID=A0A915PYG4_9BILA